MLAKRQRERIYRAGIALPLALFVAALVTFALKHPVLESVTFARTAHPPEEHNLAALEYGPTVRASSMDRVNTFHPLYVVDGKTTPTPMEKWSSESHDEHPWIEVRWDRPRTVTRIVVAHAGAVESPVYTMRNYELVCLGAGDGPSMKVTDNTQAVATHLVACPNASGVRIEFEREPGARAVARVYEVEAWGR
jgi:hypothetical protein